MASIILIKGDDTNWNDQQSFVINLDTTLDLTQGFSAQFTIGNIVKEFDSIVDNKIYPVLTNKETSQLPLGYINGVLKIYDSKKRIKTIKSNIPFVVQKGVFTSNKDINADSESLPIEEINLTINSTDIIDYNSIVNKPVLNGHELKGEVVLTKSDIGLSNADNTSDLNKPISIAVQNALDNKTDKSDLEETNTRVEANSTELTGIKADIAELNTELETKATSEELAKAIESIDTTAFATKEELKEVSDSIPNISNLAAKDEIPTKTSELTNDSGFLTEHQSLENYALKVELPVKVSELENDSKFITEAKVEEAISKIDIPTVPTEVSAFNNDAKYTTLEEVSKVGYLTEHQDISDLATQEELETLEAKIPTKVSQLVNDSDFLTSVPSNYVTETELSQTLNTYITNNQFNTVSEEIAQLTEQVGLNTSELEEKADKTETNSALNLKVNRNELNQVAFTGSYSDLTGTPSIVTSDEITKIKKLTQAEYDALKTKDEATWYVIAG